MSRNKSDDFSREKLKIAFLCFDDFQMLDLTGPMDVFTDENILDGGRYSVVVCSMEGGLVASTSGLSIESKKCGSLKGYNSLVVVGGRGVRNAIKDPLIINYIEKQANQVSRVISICTGAFLLAKAGLLNDRKAATHWAGVDNLQRAFPQVEVVPDDIYVKSGNVYTSAGITAGIDLALSIVAEDFGHDVSMRVAKNLVVYSYRLGGQKQFSNQLQAQIKGSPIFETLIHYIDENLDKEITVVKMAEISNMSGRNFSRKFTAEMKLSPAKYVEAARIERIKLLLEMGGIELSKVASLTGFASVDVMRRAFVRYMGVTPLEYGEGFSLKR